MEIREVEQYIASMSDQQLEKYVQSALEMVNDSERASEMFDETAVEIVRDMYNRDGDYSQEEMETLLENLIMYILSNLELEIELEPNYAKEVSEFFERRTDVSEEELHEELDDAFYYYAEDHLVIKKNKLDMEELRELYYATLYDMKGYSAEQLLEHFNENFYIRKESYDTIKALEFIGDLSNFDLSMSDNDFDSVEEYDREVVEKYVYYFVVMKETNRKLATPNFSLESIKEAVLNGEYFEFLND